MSDLFPTLVLNGHYQLQRPIGFGGFSTVWLAVDMRDNRSVAIKISQPDKDRSGEMPDRFARQYASTQHLRHERLLTPLDFFLHEKSGCLVLDYMANGTLHDKVKRDGTLPEMEVAKVMSHVASALEYLHQHQFIHFDVKPENILINARGDYFLADFDTASRLENAMVRVSRIYADTPQYRSPEHLLGAAELSEKVDVFALGITLFELCEGIIERDLGIGMMLLAGQEKPTLEGGKYAARLQQIILACWNQSPSDRPSGDALATYSRQRLEQGSWPHVLEYNANDRVYQNQPPISARSSTARVTVRATYGADGAMRASSTPRPTERMPDFGQKETPQPQPTAPASMLPPVEPKAAEQKAWSPPSVSAPQPQTPSFTPTYVYENTDNSMKWVPAVIALLLLCVGGYFGCRYLKNRKVDADFAAAFDQAVKYRDEGKYKLALEQDSAALLIKGDLPEVQKLRYDIFARARMQHEDIVAQVKTYFASRNIENFALACQLLTDGAENASILNKGDSTEYYKTLVCDIAPEEKDPDWDTEPGDKPLKPKPQQLTPEEIAARQQRAADAQRRADEAKAKREADKLAKLDAAARKKAQEEADRQAREEERIRKEREEEDRKKREEAAKEQPLLSSIPPSGAPSSSWQKKPDAQREFIEGAPSVTIRPKVNLRLIGTYLAVKNCGIIHVALLDSKGATLAEDDIPVAGIGLEEIDLTGLTYRLQKGEVYKLTFMPRKGGKCPANEQPKIEKALGNNTYSNAQWEIQQSGGVFLYDLKGRY